jgi:nanoRNase/pAp phosphatase (c-di-AMP/oligoRNAs hydrolase)
MAISASRRIQQFYEQFQGTDRVLIVIVADPDAMASAMAVKRLLWRKVSGVDIARVNEVNRPDNLAMIQRLAIKMQPLDDLDLGAYSRFVIIDAQPDHHKAFGRISPDVVIDHHPDTGIQAAVTDIRPQYGAVSSMMTEYLRAARIKPSIKLATGLLYGIKTDTRNFERQTIIEDVRAFQYLFRFANKQLINAIEREEINVAYLKYYRRAIEKRRKRKDWVFVHLGTIDTSDVCVLIADFLMRISTFNWSVVSGIVDQTLVVVFRNDGMRKNAGRIAKQSFGHLGSAGGHKGMARAEIDLAMLKPLVTCRDDEKMGKWLIRQIQTRSRNKR